MSTVDAPLRRPALFDRHVALGAKMVGFGGWEMALSYPAGTVTEHRACRNGAVAFDVSHLGTVRVGGAGAFDALQAALTNDLGKISPGRAQYTHLLDPNDASVLDDIIVWWRGPELFDVMPNASNTDRVVGALSVGQLAVNDVTSTRSIIAIQGPSARELLRVVSVEAADVGRFRVAEFSFEGVSCVVAGTGYTGEDGVECAVPDEVAAPFWDAVLGAGIEPAGLGARDTLRLEAGLPLHGHELGPGISTLQAGLGWVVSWTKGEFRGREALAQERDAGVARRLVGLALPGRQPAREGATVHRPGADASIGIVSSGNFSPTLDHAIALAFVDASAGDLAIGTLVELDVRGRRIPGAVVALPFVAKR
jgi:aminomethyltransferase